MGDWFTKVALFFGKLPWFDLIKLGATGLCGYYLGRTKERRESIKAEVVACIKVLQESSRSISLKVVDQLTGSPKEGLTQDDAQKIIDSELKYAYGKVKALQVHIEGEHSTRLHLKFLEWKGAITDNGYPVKNKRKAFKPTDHQIIAVQTAAENWALILENLLADCFAHKIKYCKR